MKAMFYVDPNQITVETRFAATKTEAGVRVTILGERAVEVILTPDMAMALAAALSQMAKRVSRKPAALAAPSPKTLEGWLIDDGVARATDGCRVEPDGECPHGAQSWLLVLGYI